MRILCVHPGADFSVADVERGWVKALRALGNDVAVYNMNDRLVFYANCLVNGKKIPNEQVVEHAAFGLHGKLWEWQPDLLVVISGFYLLPVTWELLKYRPHKTCVIFTESPYEDDRQWNLVASAEPDLVILNDPKNRERFDAIHNNVHYLGHCFDPEIHYPATGARDLDFTFVGTGYPSRRKFFEQVDFSNLDVAFAGHWKGIDGPLASYLQHPSDECYPNEDAADLYRRSKVSANLYRGNDPIEANQPDLMDGWACGPREIELAACETFFLREPRGEGDDLFPMLPTFTEPDEFSELLRWWVAHESEREDAARRARKAVQHRTFDAAARRLLNLAGD
jgi:hypothetical protein